ncbi:MAG TPA: hypothetical protein VIU93_06410 [Gallionellaceae bacterium]
MDSRTHVELARRLLSLCNADDRLSVVSLFPQIDRWPHTLHRMYAHTVFKAHTISEIGLNVLAYDSWTDTENVYEVTRFQEEKERLLTYLPEQSLPAGLGQGQREAILMSYISHIYLDTYNQPAQPFAPLSVYCAGQWHLWEQLGDFRRTLYTTQVIDALRADLFADRFWADLPAISATALIQAMLKLMCEHSLGKISENVIPDVLNALSLTPCLPTELDTATAFLHGFEDILNRVHVKHLVGKPRSYAPIPAAELAVA